MTLKDFFDEAKEHNWKMSWKAWKTLIFATCEYGVLDDDSGFYDDSHIGARDASVGFYQCTVGPARLFTNA